MLFGREEIIMVDYNEVEETDKDADSLKPPMTLYLESLDAAIKTYWSDQAEFEKIQLRLQSDFNVLSALNNKVTDHITYLKTVNTKKSEAIGLIVDAVRARKS